MADFGMQMPGGRARTGPTPDVYTALIFLGVVALIAACAVTYIAASQVSPEAGQPFAIQPENPSQVRLTNR